MGSVKKFVSLVKMLLSLAQKNRQETYALATTSSNKACVKMMNSEVAFVEVPLPAMNPVSPGENGFRPDITINIASVISGFSNPHYAAC